MFYDVARDLWLIRADFKGDPNSPDAPRYSRRESVSGYVHRVREYLERVEKHLGISPSDDTPPHPDDDI